MLCVLPQFNDYCLKGAFLGLSRLEPSLKVEAGFRRDGAKNAGESDITGVSAQQGHSPLSSLERKPPAIGEGERMRRLLAQRDEIEKLTDGVVIGVGMVTDSHVVFHVRVRKK